MKGCRGIVLGVIGWLMAPLPAHQPADVRAEAPGAASDELRRQEATVLGRIPLPFRDGAVVVAWSQRAYDIAFAEDQFLTFKGHRVFAMMHIAIHDALNAIAPVYRQYTPLGRSPMADPIAAAAQAARDVLASQYPGEQADLDADLAEWLSQVPDGTREARGIELGQQAAAAILALRERDGWDSPGRYTFQTQPGAYQTTPPWNGFVAQPGFRFAKPFGLETPQQFRPQAPPGLHSTAYAAAYNEVKEFGRADSTVRTPEQTGYAIWWMEFTEGSVNRLARRLVTQRRTHMWRAARLFALLNMAIFDSYVAVWDAKYEHNHWRPYTAVREAALDGNPATEPDLLWEPLRPTPPFPEYVSAHAAACASSFQILRRTFGDDLAFRMESTTAPPEMPTRSFRSFSAAATECADSRVRLGFHFRYATDDGLALGRAVARHVADHQLEFRWASEHRRPVLEGSPGEGGSDERPDSPQL